MLPYDPVRREALLVRQLRIPAFVAAGLAARLEGPEPAACAAREAFEECDVSLGSFEPVGMFWAMPAVSTERIHLFLAPYRTSDRTGPGGGLAHENEDITVEVLPLDALARMVDEGALPDMRTALLLYALRHRYPDLFTH